MVNASRVRRTTLPYLEYGTKSKGEDSSKNKKNGTPNSDRSIREPYPPIKLIMFLNGPSCQGASMITASLPRWDLRDLYQAIDDPQIDLDLARIDTESCAFAKCYENRLTAGAVTPAELYEAFHAYEAIARLLTRLGSYASLLYSTDTKDPHRGAFLQKIREHESLVASRTLFFDLELGQVPESIFKAYLKDPILTPYYHYLNVLRDNSAFHLSQAEELILEKTANSRGRAFRRLFTEIVSRMTFTLALDGELQTLTQAELLAYNYHTDRSTREKASQALATTLKDKAPELTFIMNTLLAEKDVLDRLRGFTRPESSRHLDNELPESAVDTMIEVVTENFPLVEDYYKLKAHILGLDKLQHFDRYAPLLPSKKKIPYERACQIVLEAYHQFSPIMHDLAQDFFQKNWIDVPVSEGKRGGAFCAGVSPDLHPFILLNYTQEPHDVMTLAHELGHGIHDRLASKQHVLDYHPVLPLAETASIFGEMLTFERLFQELDSDEDRLALLCEKLEGTFATVFRQASMFCFERQIHAARREQGELTTAQYNDLWQECMGAMFGTSLELGEDHAWTWLYIPHIIQTPFYVYAYAFGELLVLALYARYRAEGESFVATYLDLLAAGGSKAPQELLAQLGIDITQPSFWQGGCDLISASLCQAKELAHKLGKGSPT